MDQDANGISPAEEAEFVHNRKVVKGERRKDEQTRSSNKKRGRHGARNQHRHKLLVKWIVQKFPQAIEMAKENVDNQYHIPQDGSENASVPKMHILDVAGGKGELSARLTICHRLNVIMVDPRPADILDCFHKNVFRSLPKKWQEKINSNPNVLPDAIERRFKQHVAYFPSDSDGPTCLAELLTNEELLEAVKGASLIIGMHSDGATEAIVDIAKKYRKPFLVVPCCVFPNFFKHRFIPRDSGVGVGDDDTPGKKSESGFIPVRSHEQFCRYLHMKDSHFQLEKLPFEGRNIAICWDGCHLDSDNENITS